MNPNKTTNADSEAVRDSLGRPEIHDQWESAYRSDRNERFYERVFDELVTFLPATIGDSEVLDAGCGGGAHSLRLARRGFKVRAIDFSESVLGPAREKARAHGLEDRIRVQQADLLELPFEDGAFSGVLCWGVLMHVPDVRKALSELARVTAPDGVLILNEVNAAAPEARLLRAVLPRFAKTEITLRETPEGIEHWTQTASGPLMWRHANIPWFVAQVESLGFSLRLRRAAQLSELYTRPRPKFLQPAVHALNTAWFERVRRPSPALGNMLVFDRT
jgi:2-polyprenyl-3-methyl-5-hydroxy-6-metoxy-1,4-benzoquinol methylase